MWQSLSPSSGMQISWTSNLYGVPAGCKTQLNHTWLKKRGVNPTISVLIGTLCSFLVNSLDTEYATSYISTILSTGSKLHPPKMEEAQFSVKLNSLGTEKWLKYCNNLIWTHSMNIFNNSIKLIWGTGTAPMIWLCWLMSSWYRVREWVNETVSQWVTVCGCHRACVCFVKVLWGTAWFVTIIKIHKILARN